MGGDTLPFRKVVVTSEGEGDRYVSAGESLLGRTEVKAVDVWSVEEPLSSMPSQPCPLVEVPQTEQQIPSFRMRIIIDSKHLAGCLDKWGHSQNAIRVGSE